MKTRLTHSFSTAFDWWWTGLTYLWSSSSKSGLQIEKNTLLLYINKASLKVCFYRHNTEKADIDLVINHQEESELLQLKILLAAQINTKTLVTLVLDDADVLTTSSEFPLKAEHNLEAIIGFELDQITPFNRDQCFYDWQIVERNSATQTLKCELFAISKMMLTPWITLLERLDLSVHRVTSKNACFTTTINLLDNRYTHSKQTTQIIRNRLVLGTAIATFFMMLYIPLIHQDVLATEMKQKLLSDRSQAIKTKKLETQLNALQQRQGFLSDKRQQQDVLNVLNELTAILPDNTWLERCQIIDKQIDIQGESESAASIIQDLETSPYFDAVSFKSPVTQNKQSGKQRFHVAATINQVKMGSLND